jgi:hypothetical protein
MSDLSREPGTTEETPEEKAVRKRRDFLKTAGTVAVTIPAVALLLSMESKRANAVPVGPSGQILDFNANP